jgi:hypothetical protein
MSIKRLAVILGLTVSIAACSRGEAVRETPSTGAGSDTPAAASAADDRAPAAPQVEAAAPANEPEPEARVPEYREITIPAGTTLPVTLRTAVASDTSQVEDQVRGTLRRAITVEGIEVLPAGAVIVGHVTDAVRSAKVKGRARVAFRFTRIDLPGEGGPPMIVRTGTVARLAPATKKRDAATIGGGAVGGAIVGGLIGGGDGAAKGAAIGGAGGTGVVLATRGKEVRLEAGAPISVKLTQPLTVRVAR